MCDGGGGGCLSFFLLDGDAWRAAPLFLFLFFTFVTCPPVSRVEKHLPIQQHRHGRNALFLFSVTYDDFVVHM